jgi:hypothetical protein
MLKSLKSLSSRPAMRSIIITITFIISILFFFEAALRIFRPASHKYLAGSYNILTESKVVEGRALNDNDTELERHELFAPNALPIAVHPSFGFHYAPQHNPEINNDGFNRQRKTVNTNKNSRPIVIGLFGGTVARKFYEFQLAKAAANRGNLADKLSKSARSIFFGKDIQIENFAIDHHNQPQHFYVSTHNIQKIDLALTIEMPNLSDLNRSYLYHPTFPRFSELLFSYDPHTENKVTDLIDALQSHIEVRDRLMQSQNYHTFLSYRFVVDLYIGAREKRFSKLSEQLISQTDLKKPYQKEKQELHKQIKQQADIWQRFTRKQALFFNLMNKDSYHLVASKRDPQQENAQSTPLIEYFSQTIGNPGPDGDGWTPNKNIHIFQLASDHNQPMLESKRTNRLIACCLVDEDDLQQIEDHAAAIISKSL